MFIPIISTLLNVFVCDKGSSESISDSILKKDCDVYCWKDDHLSFAIASAIGILCY